MIEIEAWIHRARAFIRGLAHLPGTLVLSDEIEPAPNDDYHRKWLESDDCSLPPEVHRFVSLGSARCAFHYQWTPPAGLRRQVQEILPGCETVCGGADFCEASFAGAFHDSLGGALTINLDHQHHQRRSRGSKPVRDWLPWLQRAERFVRRTCDLPGRWCMTIAIEPPLDSANAARLDRVLPHGLPELLRDFYLTASACADCSFSWSPDELRLAALAEVLPHQRSIYAGPKICSAAKLEEEQQGLMGWAEIFDEMGGHGPATAQVLRDSVPFIPIGNGDQLVLQVKPSPDRPRVIYISHETDVDTESPVIPISESGEQFMADWERIAYLGPEIWLLNSFVQDSSTGLLDSGSPLASRWRAFLKGLRLPIHD